MHDEIGNHERLFALFDGQPTNGLTYNKSLAHVNGNCEAAGTQLACEVALGLVKQGAAAGPIQNPSPIECADNATWPRSGDNSRMRRHAKSNSSPSELSCGDKFLVKQGATDGPFKNPSPIECGDNSSWTSSGDKSRMRRHAKSNSSPTEDTGNGEGVVQLVDEQLMPCSEIGNLTEFCEAQGKNLQPGDLMGGYVDTRNY
ncbi:hypothetical protein SESBI_39789 [Sesbania bispinosa]|nr:hypothetical protein SESBI_39789 [Sesbania bispinosa]